MRAVVFGWNTLDPQKWGGWSGKLNWCESDAEKAAESWRSHGIPTRLLLSKDATIASCKKALTEAVEELPDGGWLLIHISGHGGRTDMSSINEDDGVDEYVCAYDGPIMDNTINDWIHSIRKRIYILWMCDTCHSATMHRSAPPIFSKKAIPEDFPGGLILISGCEEDSYSWESAGGGVLSVASRATGPVGVTPISWYNAIKDRIPETTQKPQYVEYMNVPDEFKNGIIIPA